MFGYNLSDRRGAFRLYVGVPITCEIFDLTDKKTKHKNAMIKDISSTGVYFETDELLTLNLQLNVIFQLAGIDHPVNATIRVVRVETVEETNNFGIGAEFTKLEEKDKRDLEQLIDRLNINRLLELTIKKGASDLHLITDSSPILRIFGDLELLDSPKLSAEDINQMLYSIMNKHQIRKFEQEKELDFGIQFDSQNRFRINVHQQRGFLEAALRLINTKTFSFQELNIPAVVKDLARLKSGLVIISGPTGSGKTTTIATMIDLINQERKAVIITLERPIEYVFLNNKSIVKQREVGIDTISFSSAIKSTLKQDPNVIVIGELDDIETVRTALIAAETGYLVIASFHAPNTLETIDRLANIFPAENRRQVLSQLSNCLKGIVCQLLIPRKDKKGRVLASEVLIVNDAAKRIIRDDALIQLRTVIQTGAALKMQSMHDAIRHFIGEGIIDEAVECAF